MSRQRWQGLKVLSVLALVAAVGAVSVVAAQDELPVGLRAELEAALKAKVSSLVAEKDSEGYSFRRAAYSKNFRKVDENTYLATMHRDTIERDTVKTERLLLTLKKDSGKWSIAKEEVQETYTGLHRELKADDQFARFDKMSFDREGLKITATKGSMVRHVLEGKPSAIFVTADDLAYEYSPPRNAEFSQINGRFLMKKYKEDWVFKPKWARINCDPTSCEEILATTFTGVRTASKGETSKDMNDVYDDSWKEFDKTRKDNPFLGFRLPIEPERRTWTALIRKDSPVEHTIFLSYDNWDGWDLQFGSTKTGPVFGYYSEQLLKSATSPYDLEKREDQDALFYDLDSLKGTVEIVLDESEAVRGDITFVLSVKKSTRELPFFIFRSRVPEDEKKQTKNPNLFVNSIRDGEGNELTWVKTGAYSGLVIFPTPLAPGTKLTLSMQYTNYGSIYKLNPTFFSMDRFGWIPFVRFTDPIEVFDLTVKSPSKYTLLGPGRKESESKEGDNTVTRWVGDKPVSFPTIIWGDYVSGEPSIKATKSDGTPIPVKVWVDKTSTNTIGEEKITSYEEAVNANRAFDSGARGIRGNQLPAVGDQAVNALNLYREVYNTDYPYGKLDLVADPLGFLYGQAPASIIYLGFGVFRGEGTLGNVAGDATKFLKDVVAHETGHQWWGSTVGNFNNRNYWFIESLTEYSSAIFVESAYGRKRYDDKVAGWRRTLMSFELLSSVQNASALWGGEFPGASYVANVYNKGPYAFHVLRQTFGDEKFFKFLRNLMAEFRGKQIVTRDIQRIAEESFGGTMEWFWDQWFRSAGLPQFALMWNSRETEDGKYLIEGSVKQRVVVGKNQTELDGVYFRSRGWLTFVFKDGREMKWPQRPKPGEPERMFLVNGPETKLPPIKLPEPPTEVYFNKDGEILALDTLINRTW